MAIDGGFLVAGGNSYYLVDKETGEVDPTKLKKKNIIDDKEFGNYAW